MISVSPPHEPARADVWVWSLDVPDETFEVLSALLNAAERSRAARFFNLEHARRWTVCRGQMRQILGHVAGIAPVDIVFSEEAYGRPYIADAARAMPSFNLSHTDGYATLAVSADVRIGVDIETIRPLSADEMAWPLSQVEHAIVEAAPDTSRFETFFRFWTLKEAFIKAVGKGVSLPLEDFDISGPDDGPARLLRLRGKPNEPARWSFAESTPIAGTLAAVAAISDGREMDINWHHFCNLPSENKSQNHAD